MESSWSSFTLLLTALIAIATLKFIFYYYGLLTYWKRKGVPSVPSFPIFGTGWQLLLRRITFTEYSKYLYNIFPGARYIGAMDFATPLVVIRDPELIKDITVKNFEHFPDHRSFVDENMDPIFGKNVFSLRGERWKEMRNTLSPSFTASKMRFMFELVSQCSREFADYLSDHPEWSSSIETKDAFTRYTTDVIATVAFGISVNSLKDRKNEFFVQGTSATTFVGTLRMLRFMFLRFCPRIARLTGVTFLPNSATNFFRRTVSETVQMREDRGIVRPDMIHLLMQARDKNEDRKMTIDDIVAQAFIFFLAGFDTSSTLMCYMAHELAMNPDVQEKLREEVLRFSDEKNEISYENLLKMDYMEMVVCETLRKYPPVIFIDRLCTKSYTLPPTRPGDKECTLDPNSMIWLPVYSLHHDPKYFPNPDKFDPERFSEENKDNIVPYSYLPFGLGPRKCIGNRFALMETKVLIAYLLQKFVFKPVEKTKHPIVISKGAFTLIPEGGFWIGLEKRNV